MIRSESDFLKYALSKYDNPHLTSLDEFENDLKKFTYINNLINRYSADKSDIKCNLIINHLIILSNCFTVPGVLTMLEYRSPKENVVVLNTFLYYLNMIQKSDEGLDFYVLDLLNAN